MFRPLDLVDLPEASQVEFELRRVVTTGEASDQTEVYALLDQRFHSGEFDVAARHDEHQS